MCGIAGWIGKKNKLFDQINQKENAVKKILDQQSYRGPDAEGIYSDVKSAVVMGHNRLSIIDLSETGSQPMVSKEGRWIISYNGELYNYVHLRKKLEEKFFIDFQGESDTEVFLNGIIHFGIDEFLRMADGMFAAAIYDKQKEELFLMRDRVGEKPLFYYHNGDELYFASELKSLTRGMPINNEADMSGLQLYMLLRYVPAPYTIIKNIFKLQEGHYLRFRVGDDLQQIPYYSWDPNASQIPPTKENYNQVVKATESLLLKSLEARLMSDVPLGFFLSGGIDSTLCAALIRKYFGKEINTYTIGFEADGSSEHPVAEKTASIIGSKHRTQILRQSELNFYSREFIRRLDEPNGDRSCVPTYLLCKHAKSEVTVALGGDGGDELFSGYSRYPGLNKSFGHGSFYNPKEILKAYYSNRLPVFGMSSLSIFETVADGVDLFFDSLSTNLYPPMNTEEAIRFVDFKSYLPGAVLSKVDRMSMLVSLEVRTPFFSPAILELASRLPHEFLYRGSEMKPILRDICRKIGLSHIADLPKKGFGMPQDFLNNTKEELVKRAGIALKKLDDCESIPIERFGSLLSSHAGNNMNSLWASIVLGEWFADFESSS